MDIIYQFTIKADCNKTVLVEKGDQKRRYPPISTIYGDARECPIITASLLRDLAKWAIERAEIIEDLESGKPKKAS